MRAALERPGAEARRAAAAASAGPARGLALLALGLGALVAAALFAGGGSGDGAVFPIGAGALGLAALASAAALAGLVPWPRPGRAGALCVALLALLALWSAASAAWSIAPDRSWAAANRDLAYAGLLASGLFLGSLARRAPTIAAAGATVLVAAAAAFALAGKVAPGLAEDGGRIARLRAPVGYWNGLALVLTLGIPLALWLASGRRHPYALRAAAVALLYVLAVALLLTYSRGGVLAALAAVLVWLVLVRTRLEGVAALLVAAPLAAGVFAFALRRPGVVDDGQSDAVRVADGRALGVALGLGFAAAFALAYAVTRLEARRPLSAERRALVARRGRLALLCLGAAAALALGIRGGATAGWIERQAHEFANPPTELVTQGAGRLTSLSSNNRWIWWNEAWQAFRAAPLGGTGAGSFATAHRLLREDALTVTEPHSVPLQFLAETGAVGALLAGGAVLAALAGGAASLRRLASAERPAGAALLAGLAAYAVHALVDFDWDFLAVTAPVIVLAGVLLGAGRPAGASRRSLAWLPVPAALLAACVVALGAPWLAGRKVDEAYAALGAGRLEAGLATADRARSLDPLSLDPLFARASALAALGDVDGARRALIDAVELQPLDPDAWYELGAFELGAGRAVEARRYLERSRELDPFGPAAGVLARTG